MVEKEKSAAKENVPAYLAAINQVNAIYKKARDKTVIKTFAQVNDGKDGLEVIPTGVEELDEASGIGGLAKGTMVEIFGPESSGKSWLGYQVIANCQKKGWVAALIDAEQSGHRDWLKSQNINLDSLIYENDAISMEEHLKIIDNLCGHVDVIMVDSTAALVPKSEMDGEIGDAQVAAQSRVLSPAIRKLMQSCKGNGGKDNRKTLIIWINQLRDKIGAWGNPETTPGGKALKFYCHMRIDARRVSTEKIKMSEDEDTPVAQISKGTFVKNKLGIPWRKFGFRISFESALSNPIVLLVQMATKKKIFYKTKGEYKFINLEDEKIVTSATDFIVLANWAHKNGFVMEIVDRVKEALERDGEAICDFLEHIDDTTVPPPAPGCPGQENQEVVKIEPAPEGSEKEEAEA